MKVPEPYEARLKALRKKLTAQKLGALLVFRPENRRYLSGFEAEDTQIDESSGCLLITARRQYLLTDFRYETEARRQAVGFDVRLYQGGAARTAAELVRRARAELVGFEEDIVTVQAHQQLEEALDDRTAVPAAGLVEELRVIKDKREIRLMTKALRITEEALARTWAWLEPGRNEIETARFLEEAMLDLGAEGTAFESIVASGPNAALPHAVPGLRRIKEGEPVIFDCGARYKGYRADMTRTIFLGKPKPFFKTIYSLVRRAQTAAIKGIKPGMMTDAADALARDVIDAGGYGPQFGHSLGHGVGLATHEKPSLSRLRATRLEPGMVVTIEPGVYLEGRGGVRLEEMALITERGVKILNRDQTFYDWSSE